MKLAKPPRRGPKPRRRIPRKTPSLRTIRRSFDRDSFRSRVKRANELWRHLIYTRASGLTCDHCGRRPWVEAAHCFIKGRHFHLRFDPCNGWPLCRPCHRIIDSDHIAKERFFREAIGNDQYDRLLLWTQSKAKLDMALVLIDLERLLAAAQNAPKTTL